MNPFVSPPLAGDCTITANTVWGNGTLTLAGNLNVNSGVSLTLWNMVVKLNLSSDQQYRIDVAGGQFIVRGGTLTSANPSYGWRLETSSDAGSLVDLDRTNVSCAGSGSSSGFLLLAGNGHRFRHLTVTQSALGSSSGVIDVNGAGISDVRVENSTFTGTGPAYYVHAIAGGANAVFSDNTITGYTGSGSAIFAEDTQILGNAINAGTAPGVTLWGGGGPGWPSKNAYNVSGNTITTTGEAVYLSSSSGYDVTWNHIVNGHSTFSGNGNRFAYNNVTGTDERVTSGHIVTTSPNSTFDHNTLWNVGLTTDSGFLVLNYGNVKVTDNRLFLHCDGSNCMGVEVINVQSAQRAIYPGFPTVEVARNHIVWTAIASGGLTIMLDNEYSQRVYLHNNTEAAVPGTGTPTSSLQGGGVEDSVYENNTIYGPTTYCIYEYIYAAANNLFQYNRCNGGYYGGIFQTGGNVYRDNVFTNLTGAGIFICPPGSCAGSATNTTDNAWFNNTFTFASATPYLTRMDLGDAFYNSFLGHGANNWWDGTTSHPIYGDWLFFANAPITHLAFADRPDGHRTLTLTAGGHTYWDQEPLAGVKDSASLAVDGSLDAHGSVYGTTVLASLNPRGNTSLQVSGMGTTTFTLAGFVAGYTYNITLRNLNTGVYRNGTLGVNAQGSAAFTAAFGTTVTPYSVAVWGSFPTPPGDTTPPAQVTDLRAAAIGSAYAVLEWTAPGDNGTVGQASQYDLRFSTTAPIINATFAQATRVPTPPPGVSGTTTIVNVTGLAPDTQYWFALRTADAVPNWSPLSNVAAVLTLPPPSPAVASAWLNASASFVEVAFTHPMNRTSVQTALAVAPSVAYHLVWIDDAHVQIVFDAALARGTAYNVTISTVAEDQQGVHLGAAFSYRFTTSSVRPTPGPTPPAPTPWIVVAFVAGMGGFYAAAFVYGSRMSARLARKRLRPNA